MNWWRRWRERRRSPLAPVEPYSIEQLYEDSPTETPFLELVAEGLASVADQEQFGYPELFGADQEKYWGFYQTGAISLAQYKALGQLFYKTKNNQLSPEQVTTEYLAIMGADG